MAHLLKSRTRSGKSRRSKSQSSTLKGTGKTGRVPRVRLSLRLDEETIDFLNRVSRKSGYDLSTVVCVKLAWEIEYERKRKTLGVTTTR